MKPTNQPAGRVEVLACVGDTAGWVVRVVQGYTSGKKILWQAVATTRSELKEALHSAAKYRRVKT